jgi:hypothetical protein
MLKDIDNLEKEFQAIATKSDQECKNELEELRKFIHNTRCIWDNHIENVKTGTIDNKKWVNSLIGWCFFESVRTCGHTLHLAHYGLYRNAFDNIRHMLESIIQALYLDLRYRGIDNVIISRPEPNIFVKLAILREVEDKRDYHALRLIDELDIGYKDRIKQIYRELSQTVHPSHRQIEQTLEDFYKRNEDIVVTIDCAEISNICKSLINVYDVVVVFYMTYFPEVKKSLSENKDFVNFVKNYKLYLVLKMLKDCF